VALATGPTDDDEDDEEEEEEEEAALNVYRFCYTYFQDWKCTLHRPLMLSSGVSDVACRKRLKRLQL